MEFFLKELDSVRTNKSYILRAFEYPESMLPRMLFYFVWLLQEKCHAVSVDIQRLFNFFLYINNALVQYNEFKK